jgi:serine/threonine-protein kinase
VLFDRIGEGGMARIYLGRARTDLGGERLTVVKQILPLLSSSATFSGLLIEEAKLAAELSHGSIVQVFDLGREESVLYIAMEYVEGFDLRQLLQHCARQSVPLPVEFSLFIVSQTLRALDYAHRKADDAGRPLGIVHRDVSPSNVLVSFDGEVKLCDFGIARAIGTGDQLLEEAIQGKAGYMSPEGARGEPLDVRADVFSAGVILWELLAGRRMYRGSNGKPPSLQQAREAVVPPLPERGYPDEQRLYALVARALAKNPDERFASAREALSELEDYIAEATMYASPLRLGEWLMDHFGNEIVETRRARERAAKAVEAGPLIEMQSRPDDELEVSPESQRVRDSVPASVRAPPSSSRARVSEPAPASGVGAWARAAPRAGDTPKTLAIPIAIGLLVVIVLWAWLSR